MTAYIIMALLWIACGVIGVLIGHRMVKKGITFDSIDWNKFLSREFLVTVASEIITFAGGIGLEVEPAVIIGVAASIASIYTAARTIQKRAESGGIKPNDLSEIIAEAVSDIKDDS